MSLIGVRSCAANRSKNLARILYGMPAESQNLNLEITVVKPGSGERRWLEMHVDS